MQGSAATDAEGHIMISSGIFTEHSFKAVCMDDQHASSPGLGTQSSVMNIILDGCIAVALYAA